MSDSETTLQVYTLSFNIVSVGTVQTCSEVCETLALVLVCGIDLPLWEPAVITHHVWVEPALIPCFHDRNVLVEPFAMFITYLTQIRWEEIKMRMQEVHFKRHPTAHSPIGL